MVLSNASERRRRATGYGQHFRHGGAGRVRRLENGDRKWRHYGARLYFDALGLAPNGFVALAQYDDPELGGNDDGYISAADKVWRRLLLWLDANADGLCDPEEMMAVPRTLITHLETLPTEHRQRDANGNRLRYWAQCHVGTAPLTRPFDMVDVFFKQVD